MRKLFLFLTATLFSIGLWATDVEFSGTNLNVPKTIDGITLSVPANNGFSYSSNKLSAGGSGKFFTLTANNATISKVVIYTDNNNNRFQASNITNCSDCSAETVSSKKVYTCSFSSAQTEISFKNNGGGVGVEKLVVTYAPSGYTVTINPNGGTTSTEGWTLSDGKYTKSGISSGTAVALPTMSKTGHTFTNFTNASTSATVASPVTVTSDMTLNANYSINSHTLTWTLGDGASITSTSGTYTEAGSVNYGTTLVAPTVERDGYDFTGWSPAVPATMPDEDVTCVAQWQTAAAKHSIEYTNLKGSDVSAYPTQYAEGVGVASFAALEDVAGFHFNGWSPASIATTATTDQTIEAQWLPINSVTFTVGTGSGTAPEALAKWQGQVFNLPGQGSMVAPAGKAFDGWKAGGVKYAAGAEYTMGNASVEFVAQWKGTPTTIFHWRSNTGTITIDAANGTTTGGTTTLRTSDGSKSWSNESATYDASVDADMKCETSGKELKTGATALYLEFSLTSGTFQEGDTIFVTGYNPWVFSTSTSFSESDVADTITTGSSKTDVKTGYAIVNSDINASTIYARRALGSGSGIAAIKVIRPAAREIVSTVITLSDVKVNNHSISSDSLAALVSAGSLELKDSYLDAPVIKFNEHTVITYDEGEPTIKDKVYTVTATENAGAWRAQQVINEVTYTVTAAKTPSYTVTYYDGNIELGSELVAASGNPADYGDYEEIYGSLASFERWENNAHETITPASIEIDKDTAFYAVYTKTYAKNVDFVGFIKASGTSGDYGTYLSSNGYLLASTTGVSLDDANAFDTGLKMKTTENNTLKFIIPAEKRVTITVGKINGMTISVNSAAAENIPSGTSAEALGSLYKESHADQYIVMTETSTAYNIIRSIIITDYGVVPTALDNIDADAKALKVLENGMLIIEKNGVRYNVTGQVIK